ncbi:radical SAM protein, partial [Candidatus Woesearchaeota archaeon]|nr:radical SAM protein [Candidatus Woesearchaeota archaeon]
MLDHTQPCYRYLFGPVPSRRLGISLGVDVMPHKTCSLDCVYCECGKTTHLTLKQQAYVEPEDIKKELDAFLSSDPQLDHITFSGSGEPTLHSGIGEIIHFLKSAHARYPVALLTNGTLFYDQRVRAQVLEADVIVASLDAATDEMFQRVNRPHSRLDLARMISGLVDLRNEYSKQLWLEIFIVPGMNDASAEIAEIQKVVKIIQPDKIHLNSLDRPGAENWVRPLDKEKLIEIQQAIEHADIVQYNQSTGIYPLHLKNEHQHIIATLKR